MRHSAKLDPRLSARVVARRPLFYGALEAPWGEDPAEDRPAHVRAGSSLCRFEGRFVVVQDDTNVLAFLDDARAAVDLLLLSRGADGRRQFDDVRGNKAFKLDLEAAVVLTRPEGEVLLCLGSGSTPERETIVVVRRRGAELAVRAREAGELYRQLRAEVLFAGSELNVEGAACVGGRIVLFQRGNGAPRAGLVPIDATGSIDADVLYRYLEESGPVPTLSEPSSYDLGCVEGARLSFTDATAMKGDLYYVAAAEDSPDATRDGPVTGIAIGRIDSEGEASYALVRDEGGNLLTNKVEGICSEGPGRFLAVVDRDEPGTPAELLTVEFRRTD